MLLPYILWEPPTSDHHNGVYRLSFDHFFRVHTHEVPQVHACWTCKAFVYGNCRELHSQSAIELNAALDGIDELRYIAYKGRSAGKLCCIYILSQNLSREASDICRLIHRVFLDIGGAGRQQPSGYRRRRTMARVEARVCIDDPDNGPR